MKKFRIGILDFCNIQDISRKKLTLSRSKNTLYKKSLKGLSLLSRAIRELGHIPVHYYPEHAQLLFEENADLTYKGKRAKGCDIVIPRINVVTHVELEISIIKQFEILGIPLINRALPIATALNKYRSLQVLTRAGIPVPKTIIVRKFDFLDDAIKLLGGYPVIIKSVFGTHGKRVALLESRRSLYSTLDLVWKYSNGSMLLLQEYIADAGGVDYRAFVIGDKVVAAMKRTAPQGDFRSNLNLGGEAVGFELTSEEKSMAVRATKAFGLDSCGVDLLRTGRGPLVMEINPCAGLTGISKVTGVNVAMQLVEYTLARLKS